MIIGWRATEFDFLKLLKPLQHTVRSWLVVNGSERAGDDVFNNLSTEADFMSFRSPVRANHGFSDLFSSTDFRRFLQRAG